RGRDAGGAVAAVAGRAALAGGRGATLDLAAPGGGQSGHRPAAAATWGRDRRDRGTGGRGALGRRGDDRGGPDGGAGCGTGQPAGPAAGSGGAAPYRGVV